MGRICALAFEWEWAGTLDGAQTENNSRKNYKTWQIKYLSLPRQITAVKIQKMIFLQNFLNGNFYVSNFYLSF